MWNKINLIRKKKVIIDIIVGIKILRALILFTKEVPKLLISPGRVFIAPHKKNQKIKI
jgi:hypothetical protein